MAINKPKLKYVPGTHGKKRPDAANLAGQFIREWHQRHLKLKGKKLYRQRCALQFAFRVKSAPGPWR